MYDYRIIDIGSTYTKQRLFQDHRLAATAQVPTTLNDVNQAVEEGAQAMCASLGVPELEVAVTLASSSAAGGLRMVAMGFMARVTAKAAKEVSMSSGAKILEIISAEDPPAYRTQILQEIRPDIILLAGGTDYGDEDSILENARIIADSRVKAVVVVAGNIAAQPAVVSILAESGVACVRVPNIMPTIHTLKVDRARETIHREFIKQITKASGIGRLLDSLDDQRVIPTPGAVLLAAELLAKGTYKEEGIGDVIVVDLGGATTDVHSVIPAYENLSSEEIGLIVTNARQVSYRTVEGNLGMRVSATGVLQTVDPRQILAGEGTTDEDLAERFAAYCERLEQNPSHLPENDEEYRFDTLLAQTAIEVAVKRHAGYYVTEPDPVTGFTPGMPVGRDLREVRMVIGVGGIFAHRSEEEGVAILQKAFSKRGISLLPEKIDVRIDREYLLYTAGVIGMRDKSYAFKVLKHSLDFY